MRVWIFYVQTLLLALSLVLLGGTAELRGIPRSVFVAPPLLRRFRDDQGLPVHAGLHAVILADLRGAFVVIREFRRLDAIGIPLDVDRDARTRLDRFNFHLGSENFRLGLLLPAELAAAAAGRLHLLHLGVRRLVAFRTLPAVQLRLLRQTSERRIQAVQVVIEVARVALRQHVLVPALPADSAFVQEEWVWKKIRLNCILGRFSSRRSAFWRSDASFLVKLARETF